MGRVSVESVRRKKTYTSPLAVRNGIGYDASVTLNNITVPTTGTYLVKIAYTDGDTSRQSMLTVNGADTYWVNYSGLGDNDWGTPQVTYLPMKLTAGANSIKVSNPTGYIADIDWITV